MWEFNRSYQGWAYVPDFFTPEECDQIIALKERFKTISGTVGSDNKVVKEIRDSDITWLFPADETKWIYEALEPLILKTNYDHFHYDITHLQVLQLSEYGLTEEGLPGFYNGHVDTLFSDRSSALSNRVLSLSVQLTPEEQYVGGDLILYPYDLQRQVIAPRNQGTVVVFRSHIIHEVTPIKEGTRHSLVAWIVGK